MIRGKWKEVYWLERGKNEIIEFLRLDASRFSWNVSKRYVTALRIIELSFHTSHPTGICSPVRVCPSPCERISARTYRLRLRTMHRQYTGYREVYIYRYNRARIAIFFLIRDASFVPCSPIRYRFPLSIHFLPSRNGRGLVANPNSNRISLIFYTMCDDFFMLELSFSLSLFVVIAKS